MTENVTVIKSKLCPFCGERFSVKFKKDDTDFKSWYRNILLNTSYKLGYEVHLNECRKAL